MDLEIMQELINDFIKLPKLDISKKTFFSVSGYSHYEDVCSNILAFFFEQTEQHGMKDLFLKSLFELVKETCKRKTDDIETHVHREYKYIDILIEGKEFYVIIENKVGAKLNNDLKKYRDAVEEKIKGDNYTDIEEPMIIGIVLSLYSIENDDEKKRMSDGGFDNYTYRDFFDRIRKNLGYYIDGADGQWLVFLQNFINNINSLEGVNLMDKNNIRKAINFFDINNTEISKLLEMRNQIYDYFINTELPNLKLLLEDAVENSDALKRDFHFEQLKPQYGATVNCKFLKKDNISGGVFGELENLHIARTIKGWEIYIILIDKKQLSNNVLLDLLEKKGSENRKVSSWNNPNSRSISLWTSKTKDNNEITLKEVAEKAIEWLEIAIEVFSIKQL